MNNALHFKTVGSRIGMCVLDISDWCREGTNYRTWGGKTAYVCSKAVLITGGVSTALISTVEFLVLTPISTVGLLLCFVTRNKCACLEKYSVKALAYSMHSLAFAIAATLAVISRRTLPFHLLNTLMDQGLYLFSAFLAHAVASRLLGHDRGLSDEARVNRGVVLALSLLAEAAPNLFGDITRALLRDMFSPAFTQQIRQQLEGGLAQIRNAAPNIANDFPQIMDHLQNVVQRNDDGTINIDMNGSPTLHQYQTRLQRLVKEACLEVYHEEAIACAFKDPTDSTLTTEAQKAQSGREALAAVEPHVFVLLSNLAQLKELEGDIHCPEETLHELSTRRTKLLLAKQNYVALTEEQKQLLKNRLLGVVENPTGNNQVEQLFVAISELSGALYQGSLVNRMRLNVGGESDIGTDVSNIFNTAMQEARTQWQAEQHPEAATA